MPKVEAYISQRGLPPSSGQPEIPLALGSRAPITQGAEQAAHDTTYLFTLMKYRENRMEEVEQTNFASLQLDDARQRILGEIDRAHDPSDPEYSKETWSGKKKLAQQHIQTIGQDVIKKAAERGNIAGNYAAMHFPQYAASHLEKLFGQMDVARDRELKATLDQSLLGIREKALATDPGDVETYDSLISEGNDLIRRNAVLLTPEETQARLKELKDVRKEKILRYAESNAEAYYQPGGIREQLSKSGAVENIREVDARVNEYTSAKHGIEDRKRTEATRLYNEQAGKNRMDLEDSIYKGEITNHAMLNQAIGQRAEKRGLRELPLTDEAYAHLSKLVQYVQDSDGITNDAGTVRDLWNRLTMTTTTGQSDRLRSDILAAMQNRQLKATGELNGIAMLKRWSENRAKYEGDPKSTYKEELNRAENYIQRTFAAAKGSMFQNFNREAVAAESMALNRLTEWDLRHRNDPAAGTPMEATLTILEPVVKQLAAEGTRVWDEVRTRNGLPVEVRQYDTVEKLNKAYDGGSKRAKLTKEQYLIALPWIRLLEQMRQGEDIYQREQAAKPKTPSGR